MLGDMCVCVGFLIIDSDESYSCRQIELRLDIVLLICFLSIAIHWQLLC